MRKNKEIRIISEKSWVLEDFDNIYKRLSNSELQAISRITYVLKRRSPFLFKGTKTV